MTLRERCTRIRALRHALRGLRELRGPEQPDRETIELMLREEARGLHDDFPMDPTRGREDGS